MLIPLGLRLFFLFSIYCSVFNQKINNSSFYSFTTISLLNSSPVNSIGFDLLNETPTLSGNYGSTVNEKNQPGFFTSSNRLISSPARQSSSQPETSSPWWQSWWFNVLIYLIACCFILYFVFHFYSTRNKFNKVLYQQQQSIKAERQRISSEIHDDIGAGLFALQLFADLLSKRREDQEISQICDMVNEISDKIKEIIWSTNLENNNLENLLYYIQAQTTKLFLHSEIIFKANIPTDIPDINISDEFRRNTYLIVKEVVHNAIKHSEASDVALTISISKTFINIIIIDNGIGFDPNIVKKNAMGLINIKLRIEKLLGVLEIKNKTEFLIKIPYVNVQ